MRISKQALFVSTMISGVVALASAAAAAEGADTTAIQTASALQSAPAAATDAAKPLADKAKADKSDDTVAAVVVTGSRIRKNEFNSPDPIQVIKGEDAQLRGVGDAAALLQTSTIASGSPQVNSLTSTAFVSNGGVGAQTISLRGLGANRTVFLLNGRRAGAAGTRGGVSSFDLNVLPESIIDHVDILKDGASSIYGSDAVAGVVNVVTKTKFNGGQLDVFGSKPEQSGGDQYRISGSWGVATEKAYLSANFDYYTQSQQTYGQRKYTNCPQNYVFSSTTGKRADAVDPRTGKFACTQYPYDDIWLYDGTFTGLPGKLQYDYSGKTAALAPKNPVAGYPGAPAGFYVVGDSSFPNDAGLVDGYSPLSNNQTLSPNLTTTSAFFQGGYKVNNDLEAYGEVLLDRRISATHGVRQFWTYLYTQDGGDPLSKGFTGNYILSPTPVTPRDNSKQVVDFYRVLGGLRGNLPTVGPLKGWQWDSFVQYSRSSAAYGQDVILQDAVYTADGRSDFGTFGLAHNNPIPRPTASCVGYTTPISKRACVDVKWLSPDFLAGKYTAAENAFLFDNEVGHTTYDQTTFEASANGDLFKLPAGAVAGAFGVHLQRDMIDDVPGKDTLASNVWGQSAAGITKGSTSTREMFGEVTVPLLRDLPWVERLGLDLSARATTVDRHGSNETYKVGANWQITPEYRLRATYGTSFRAPALFESFLANQTSFVGERQIDPCNNWGANLASGLIPQRIATNCAAQGVPSNFGGAASATVFTGGGSHLKSETSTSYTLGAIWTPSFEKLSVAVDYFNIEILNEVTTLGPSNIVYGCLNSTNFPTDPLCSLYQRNGTHQITNVFDNFINIATQRDTGLDLTVNYRHALPLDTKLTIDLQATWTFKNTTELLPGKTDDLNGTIGNPSFTSLANLRLDHGPYTVLWNVQWIGPGSDARFVGTATNTDGTIRYKIRTEPTVYHALSVRRDLDSWTTTLGIANLFDEHPPALSTVPIGGKRFTTVGTSVVASQYDYLGRRVFVNLTKKF